MTWALNAYHNLVQISEVESGKHCDCICLSCGTPVIANKGKVKRHHFSHSPIEFNPNNCSYGLETELHLLAKQVIKDSKSLYVPMYTLKHYEDRAINSTLPLTDTKMEASLVGKIPDVTGLVDGETIAVEIAVTHPCPPVKANHFKEQGIYCVELDLSHIEYSENDLTLEGVSELLKVAKVRWLAVPAIGAIATEIHRNNRKVQTNLANRLKQINHEIELAQNKYIAFQNQMNQEIETLTTSLKEQQSVHHELIGQNEQLNKKNDVMYAEQNKHRHDLHQLRHLEFLHETNMNQLESERKKLQSREQHLFIKEEQHREREENLPETIQAIVDRESILERRLVEIDHAQEKLESERIALKSKEQDIEIRAAELAHTMAEARYQQMIQRNAQAMKKVTHACTVALEKYTRFKRATGAATRMEPLESELRFLNSTASEITNILCVTKSEKA